MSRRPAGLLVLLAVTAGVVLLGRGACGRAPGVPAAPAPAATAAADAGDAPSVRRAAPIDEASLRGWLQALPPHRAAGSPAHARTRALLLRALADLGVPAQELPFTWAGRPQGGLANVVARIPGRDPEAGWLGVSAHYDCVAVSPGADDNGSGVAVALELARRLAGGGFARELRLLFFDAEEDGLIGSGAWINALSEEDARRCAGLINLETMGFTDRRAGTQVLPPGAEVVFDPGDRGDFLLCLGNMASATLAQRVGEELAREDGPAFRVEVFPYLPGAGWVLPDTRRSDHAHFWDRGLPAVLLTDTANLRSRLYHTPGDTLESLDLPFLAAAARGVERAVIRLLEP